MKLTFEEEQFLKGIRNLQIYEVIKGIENINTDSEALKEVKEDLLIKLKRSSQVEIEGNVNNYEYMKSSLIEVAKIPVEFENIITGSKGYYHLVENRIAIKEGMSQQQIIKTMVHEITHSRLHSLDKQKNIKDITEGNTREI